MVGSHRQDLSSSQQECSIPDQFVPDQSYTCPLNYRTAAHSNTKTLIFAAQPNPKSKITQKIKAQNFGGLPKDRKKLTHGFNSYEEIKSASRVKHSGSHSLRGSTKSKSKHRQYSIEKQSQECTFVPRTTSESPAYRNFAEFARSQENFLVKKQAKLDALREKFDCIQASEFTARPSIIDRSRKINESSHIAWSHNNTDAQQSKLPFHERLYYVPIKREHYNEDETFRPQILSRSKNMKRSERADSLLYSDAQRRQQQTKVIQSHVLKRQQQLRALSKVHGGVEQARLNSKLLCRKLRGEFVQLLQAESQQTLVSQTETSAIMALTIVSELFNVELHPTKNQQLCTRVMSFLLTGEGADQNTVHVRRLWEFVKAVAVGADAWENEKSCFSAQQLLAIQRQLGYFYGLRLTKNKVIADDQAESSPQPAQISERNRVLADKHRSKKIQKIHEFLEEGNMQGLLRFYTEAKQSAEQPTQQKIIRLEDLLILDAIRLKNQLKKKKQLQEQQEIKECSFRPSLNKNSTLYAKRKKQRPSNSKQNLKPLDTTHAEQVGKTEVSEKTSTNPGKQKKSVKLKPTVGASLHGIKNVDKTILRHNIARKRKQFQYSSNQLRAKVMGNSHGRANNKQHVLAEVNNFLGYKSTNRKQI